MTVQEIKEKSTPVFVAYDVAFAGVFGSQARDEAKNKSDIDILVKFKEPRSLLDLIALEQELSGVLKRDVDVVTERALHPFVRERVFNDLRIVYGQR